MKDFYNSLDIPIINNNKYFSAMQREAEHSGDLRDEPVARCARARD